MQDDSRNLISSLKSMDEQDIIAYLDDNGVDLHIAIENLERDFNMGTIVRSANAFGVRHVHVIGRRQWNKRGAMATDKYLHVHYYSNVDEFITAMNLLKKQIIAIDNVPGAGELSSVGLPKNAVLVFGSEGAGLSKDILKVAEQVVAIKQYGSTRSINVGVAAGIVMYDWLRRHYLS